MKGAALTLSRFFLLHWLLHWRRPAAWWVWRLSWLDHQTTSVSRNDRTDYIALSARMFVQFATTVDAPFRRA